MVSHSLKICRVCKEGKDLTDFYKHKETKDGLRSECKLCWNKSSLSYYRLNKESINEKRKDYHFRSKYGLTKAEVDILRAGQNNLCSLCKLNKPLVVDHDHITGKVRELLCDKCNQGLGSFNENVEYFKEAIKYLERHK